MTNTDIKKEFLSYQEFLHSIGCKDKIGCLEAVVKYIDLHAPTNYYNHESLDIPKELIQDYEELMFRNIVGRRSI